ncbi:hypothetical protein [Pseudomonas sp. Y24-6]|uniref:hypothetical protein n=1 Tax=Pseudomonas sp. Y24-6 TaxID=2750013 RepID=UPI001CE07707|nr:hypothetical protein [Pseudomonas sp. Y24-6]MCA4965789.1 hypothetical protein [Pseudomonas sp. Y24-6]
MNKLYLSYKDVLLPPQQMFTESKAIKRGMHYQSIRSLECLVLTYWPNGKPCSLVNFFLQERGYLATGLETLETYASQLTPLIQFCHESNINFEDLTDQTFTKFINTLKLRKGRDRSKIRNITKNHCATLVDRSIQFLVWLQRNYSLTGSLIVGKESDNPQITIIEKFNKHTGRYYFKHIHSPEISQPVKTKRVMPEDAIATLKDEVFKKASPYFANKFNRFGRETDTNLTMRYMYARRTFSIWFLERTGGRPSELANYEVPDREEYAEKYNLVLPVAKKRKRQWPTRNFQLTDYDITEVNAYLDCRQEYVDHLISLGRLDEAPLSMILTEQGKPMKTRSLQKDFSRLVKSAGLYSEKISMSLFRHRFITLHILLELRDELGEDADSKHRLTDIWGEAVRRKICDRVAEKTGHADGDSLRPYYDRVFAMAKVTDGKTAVERSNDTESAMHTLLRLLYTSIKEGIALEERLSAFINEIADHIEATVPKRAA